MNAVSTLFERYDEVKGRVADAAGRSGRRPEDVILVAVTKYTQPERIKALVEVGHRHFAENQAQQLIQRAAIIDEYLDRLRILERTRRANFEAAGSASTSEMEGALGEGPVRWHMIGRLQRNKVKKLIPVVRLIHAVDSLRVAEEIQQAALKLDRDAEILIQVDCSGEATKGGCPMPAVIPMIEQIATMANVTIRGLMTMAPHEEDPERARPIFARCRELFEEINAIGLLENRFDLLSMGMTADYEVAIEEGSNIVRVGSAIFGAPPEDADAMADDPDDD